MRARHGRGEVWGQITLFRANAYIYHNVCARARNDNGKNEETTSEQHMRLDPRMSSKIQRVFPRFLRFYFQNKSKFAHFGSLRLYKYVVRICA